MINKWLQLFPCVVPRWIIDFYDLDAWPKSCIQPCFTTGHWLSMRGHGAWKMSQNEENKIKSRYKCLQCFKRTKHGTQRLFLSTVTSKISKKIRELVLKGRPPNFDDVVCNKCKHRLTARIISGKSQSSWSYTTMVKKRKLTLHRMQTNFPLGEGQYFLL